MRLRETIDTKFSACPQAYYVATRPYLEHAVAVARIAEILKTKIAFSLRKLISQCLLKLGAWTSHDHKPPPIQLYPLFSSSRKPNLFKPLTPPTPPLHHSTLFSSPLLFCSVPFPSLPFPSLLLRLLHQCFCTFWPQLPPLVYRYLLLLLLLLLLSPLQVLTASKEHQNAEPGSNKPPKEIAEKPANRSRIRLLLLLLLLHWSILRCR